MEKQPVLAYFFFLNLFLQKGKTLAGTLNLIQKNPESEPDFGVYSSKKKRNRDESERQHDTFAFFLKNFQSRRNYCKSEPKLGKNNFDFHASDLLETNELK